MIDTPLFKAACDQAATSLLKPRFFLSFVERLSRHAKSLVVTLLLHCDVRVAFLVVGLFPGSLCAATLWCTGIVHQVVGAARLRRQALGCWRYRGGSCGARYWGIEDTLLKVGDLDLGGRGTAARMLEGAVKLGNDVRFRLGVGYFLHCVIQKLAEDRGRRNNTHWGNNTGASHHIPA